jgi:hypothetical protein
MRTVGVDNVVIEELDSDVGNETFWISHLISQGHPIVNQIGRDGVRNSMSQESRQKISSARKGKATWIKGLRGEQAGWTEERRRAQGDRIRARWGLPPRDAQ